ncbi:hypothetical protein AAMO2058_000813400 [Amorphochlora amoebiformis]
MWPCTVWSGVGRYPISRRVKSLIAALGTSVVLLCLSPYLPSKYPLSPHHPSSSRSGGLLGKSFELANFRKEKKNYHRGVFVSFRRSKARQYPGTALIQIEGCKTRNDANHFVGKKVAYIYKAKTRKKGSFYRAMWGKVIREHGKTGTVRAKFRKNLPASAMHQVVRVMKYPVKETDYENPTPMRVSDFNETHFSVDMPPDYNPPKNYFFEQLWFEFIPD